MSTEVGTCFTPVTSTSFSARARWATSARRRPQRCPGEPPPGSNFPIMNLNERTLSVLMPPWGMWSSILLGI